MRQVGVLAAPGLIALEKMPKLLHVDHANARRLAEGVAALHDKHGVTVDVRGVETNVVFIDITRPDLPAAALVKLLHERGVWVGERAPTRVRARRARLARPTSLSAAPRQIRAIVHHQISADMIDQALQRLEAALAALPPA